MKKTISVLLSAAMAVSAFSAISVSAADPELKSITLKKGAAYTNVQTGADETFNAVVDTRLYGQSVGQYYGTRAKDWNSRLGNESGKSADRTIFRTNISNVGLSDKIIDHGEFKITVRKATGDHAQKTYSLYKITDTDGDWSADEAESDRRPGSASYAQKKSHGYTGSITFTKDESGNDASIKVDTKHKNLSAYLADASLWEGASQTYDASKIGTDWTGGLGLGEPGGGSYELTSVSSAALNTAETSTDASDLKAGTLTFRIDGETLTKWVGGKNNGFIVRADNENDGKYVDIYMSNAHATYNKNSANAPELTIYYSDAVKLDTPKNAKIDGRVITWDAAENASGYMVQLYKDGALFGDSIKVNTNEYEIPEENISETGVYQAKITAIGSGIYVNSDETELTSTFYYYVEDGQYSFFYGQDGYKGVSDTVLWDTVGRYYYISGVDWNIGIGVFNNQKRRAIARFDLSKLKNGSFNAGEGKLTYRIATAPTSDLTLKLYKITDADGDWQAGNSASSSGIYQASKASYAQKKRHSYTGDITFARDADGNETSKKVNTNHKDFGAYLKDASLWEGASQTYDANKIGADWKGGSGLGEPGSGSYEAEPIAEATITPTSTAIEFTIPADVIKEWENADNSGFLIKADDETKNNMVTIYAANSGGKSTAATYPRLVVSEAEPMEESVELTSLSVTSKGTNVSELTADIGSIDVSASVCNGLKSEISPILIVSLYDKTGKFKSVEIKTSDTITANGGIGQISGSFAPNCGFAAGDTIKFMLWNSLGGMFSYIGTKTLADANK